MIDTVVLKIHNLKKHHNFLNKLKVISTDKFYKYRKGVNSLAVKDSIFESSNGELTSVFDENSLNSELTVDADSFKLVNIDTGVVVSDLVQSNPVVSLNVYDGKQWRSGMRGKLYSPSHHYSIDFYVNEGQDYCSIDFSVPKYIYATNVFQFVPHYYTGGFSFAKNKKYGHNVEAAYDRLMSFVNSFFKKMFSGCEIDFHEVELSRIDVCYNQLFETEKDAREYLSHLQEIHKKHIRENSKVRVNPQNGNVMFISQNYSAKIYHKGDDFQMHDRKQILAREKKSRTYIADVEKIQRFADRILRYEVTIRKGMLEYLYFQNIFRAKCDIHQTEKQMFNKVRRKMELNKLTDDQLFNRAKRRGAFRNIQPSDEIYKQLRKEVFPTSGERRFYSEFSRTTNQSLRFMLEAEYNFYFDKHHPHNQSGGTYVHFSRELFLLCVGKLTDFIREFKLQNKVSHVEAINRIRSLNASIDKHRSVSKQFRRRLPKDDPRNGPKIKSSSHMTAILMLMETGKTFDQLCRELQIPKTTKNNIKKKLKRIGFSDKSILPMSITVNHDFEEYHRWTSANMAKCLTFLFGK